MRIRSPKIAPPVKGELGSQAMTATDSLRARCQATSASARVDLPVPGAPVRPSIPVSDRGSANFSKSSRVPGSRRSTRLMARARARTLRAFRPAASSAVVVVPAAAKVVAEVNGEASVVLHERGRLGLGRGHDLGAEELRKPLGRVRVGAAREVVDDSLLRRYPHPGTLRISDLETEWLHEVGHAVDHVRQLAAPEELKRRVSPGH